MTDKLHCPFCYGELILPGKVKDTQVCVCRNPDCKYDGWNFPVEIIQQIIDGKKARDALKEARALYSGIVGSYCSSLSYFGMDTSPANLMKEFDEKIKSITNL